MDQRQVEVTETTTPLMAAPDYAAASTGIDVAGHPLDEAKGVDEVEEEHHLELSELIRIGIVGLAIIALWLQIWEPFPHFSVIGFTAALIGGYSIFKEAVSSLAARRMTKAFVRRDGEARTVSLEELGVGDVVIVKPGARVPVDGLGVGLAAFGFLNLLLAAFIHVTSELAFILNSARLLPGAIDPDQDSDSRRRVASA